MDNSQRRVARAAVLVMAAFAVSRVLGLVRHVVFSFYFGTGPEMDAYVTASRIPDLLFFVVAGGALGSAFIPMFTGRLALKDEGGAWRLASAIVNLLLAVLVPLSLLAILLAPSLVSAVLAPELPPAVQARTVELMRVMLLSTAIFGVSGVIMGTLNAHQHFLLPALAPILYNLAIIGGAAWGGRSSAGAMGAAVGMVVGAAVHLLVQVPGLVRYGARYTIGLGLDDEGVREVGRLMAPRVLGVAAVQINVVIMTRLATSLGVGAVSALDYAWKLMLLPQGVFAQAVGTAVFPTFSALAARGEMDELRRTLSSMMRTLVVMMLPAMAGLMVLGEPLVALVFERGAFSASSTEDVAWALALFSLGLVAHSLIELLARAFYALHDTWTPALAAGGAVALNLALGLALPPLFVSAGWPAHGGLALANALAALLEMLALILLIDRKLGGMALGALSVRLARPGLAALGMAGLVWLWLLIAPASSLMRSLGGILVGVGGYLSLATLFRVEELRQAVTLVLRRG
jgi:putative peptidoglycan lipid II flippase